jgi:hypothetical protein
MNRSLFGCAVAAFAFVLAVPAYAGKGGPSQPPTIAASVSKQSRTDNKVYAGINWNFGARSGATAVIGYRGAKTRDNDKVRGFKVELGYILSGAPMGFGELRIKGLAGTRDVQGEFGAGYGFHGQAFLLTGGVQGPYVVAGTDYLFGPGWQPYIGVNTLGKAKKARETFSCPAGYSLSGSTCTLIDNDDE